MIASLDDICPCIYKLTLFLPPLVSLSPNYYFALGLGYLPAVGDLIRHELSFPAPSRAECILLIYRLAGSPPSAKEIHGPASLRGVWFHMYLISISLREV